MNNKPRSFLKMGTLVVSFFCVLTLTGCWSVDKQFVDLRETVVEGVDAEYTVDVEFGVGRLILGVTKTIIGWVDDPEAQIALDVLNQVSKVQIGVYEMDQVKFDRVGKHAYANELVEYMEGRQLYPIVRTYEDDEMTLIMARAYPRNPDKIREFVVVTLNKEELVIVQLKGDIESILEIVVRERDVPGLDDAVEDAKDR